jgi:hypothetical protein
MDVAGACEVGSSDVTEQRAEVVACPICRKTFPAKVIEVILDTVMCHGTILHALTCQARSVSPVLGFIYILTKVVFYSSLVDTCFGVQ